MDCTLYGITYDKYDNEVYIPVIYFDTLKVSSIEQTAESTSARGGLGNAEHIIWDYGKDITINLQDALYTPASQNLVWGGTYGLGNMKIQGYWDPYIYKNDQYGNPIYYEKVVQLEQPTDLDKWIEIICPCDGNKKYVTYKQASGHYKYSEYSREGVQRPNKRLDEEGRFKGIELSRNNNPILDSKEQKIKIFTYEYFARKIQKQLDKAEIIVSNFKNFTYKNYQIKTVEDKGYIITTLDSTNNKEHSLLQYQWTDCDMKMVTNTVNYDLALAENITFNYHSFYNNNNKRIIFGGNEEEDIGYTSYLDFYTNVKKIIKNKDGVEKTLNFKILLGTFYIVEDFNIIESIEEYGIYPIKNSIQNVYYLDRMEKCYASNTFAIDVDKNIQSFNYSQMPEYEQANLTVFINPNTMSPYEANEHFFTRQNGEVITGNLCVIKKDDIYYKFTRTRAPAHTSLGRQVVVNAKNYPGTFKLVGETYIKNRIGEEEHYQIEIPLCKLGNNTNLTLEAEGQPVTVDMELKVMRKDDGTMIKLTQYQTKQKMYDKYCSMSTEIVPFDIKEYIQKKIVVSTRIEILSPRANEIYCVGKDCRIAASSYENDGQNFTYLKMPKASDDFDSYLDTNIRDFNYDDFIKTHREILLIAEVDDSNNINRILTEEDIEGLEITFGSDTQ